MKITVLAENYAPFALGIKAEHGFSVLIEKDGRQLLYDTGQFGLCVDNANALKCDLKKVETICLSHGHIDHTGGLAAVLQAIGRGVIVTGHEKIFDKKYVVRDNNVEIFGRRDVYIGIPFAREYLEKLLKAQFNLRNNFAEILPGVWLAGEVPFSNDFEKIPDAFCVEQNGRLIKDAFADDNSLVVDTPGGLVVILGCAHRGMVNILTFVKKKLNKKIRAVIGGTHLHDADAKQIDAVINFMFKFFKKEQTELFAPCHCTGFPTIARLAKEFREITKPAFCGTVFELE
ncbi:MAG: MBL fold metallo-hydrolase [Kiritimatiellia bacterium]|nr:MBL fold metallo-hydrolase [Kiritimatiellia bacterium]